MKLCAVGMHNAILGNDLNGFQKCTMGNGSWSSPFVTLPIIYRYVGDFVFYTPAHERSGAPDSLNDRVKLLSLQGEDLFFREEIFLRERFS